MNCNPEELKAIENDSRYHDIGLLPSRFIPYKGRMDKLFIRPFLLPELRLLSRAVQLKELTPLFRAVNACISHDVYDLTIGDFYYILMWLRIYSMPDTPYVIEWDCNQPFFKHKETQQALLYSDPEAWPSTEVLVAEYAAEVCATSNTSVVHFADVEVLMLEEGFELPEGFDFPRVSSLEAYKEAMLDPDQAFVAGAVSWFPGNTWEEKCKAANEQPDLKKFEVAVVLDETAVHGIQETVTISCRRCRVSHDRKLSIEPLHFFQ